MRHMLVAALLIAGCGGNGCGRKKPAENIEPSPPTPTPVGSAGSAAPAAKTADEHAKRYFECWGMWSAAKADEFKGCYATDMKVDVPGLSTEPNGLTAVVGSIKEWHDSFPDVKGEPVLVLANGDQVAGFALFTGTQKGVFASPLGEIPGTNNKIGILFAHALEFDATGAIKHESDYFDLATVLGQLKPDKTHPTRPALDKAPMPSTTVIAKHDDKEKANLKVASDALDAFNKHDAKAFGAFLTDDTVWSEAPEAKDWTKQVAIDNAQAVWKAFSDLKMTASASWAAGDYVVVQATMAGTNDGAMPAVGIKAATKKQVSVPFLAIHEIHDGKIKSTWVFDQGLAFAQQLGLVPPPKPAPAAGSGSAAKTAAGSGAGSAAKSAGSGAGSAAKP